MLCRLEESSFLLLFFLFIQMDRLGSNNMFCCLMCRTDVEILFDGPAQINEPLLHTCQVVITSAINV